MMICSSETLIQAESGRCHIQVQSGDFIIIVLVDLFLKGKIGFLDIVNNINRILRHKDFRKNAKRKPKSIKDIKIADNWARLKTATMCVR